MDNNRDRLGKERRHLQLRSPVFKLLRRRRTQLPASASTASTRLSEQQAKSRQSLVTPPKSNHKRSESREGRTALTSHTLMQSRGDN